MGDAYALTENFPSGPRQKLLNPVRVPAFSFLAVQEISRQSMPFLQSLQLLTV